MPTFERTDLDVNSIRLKMTLLPEDYQPKFESELKRYKKNASIKGFRKGQVPMGYILKLVGKDMYTQVILDKMSECLQNYIEENQIHVLGQPLTAEDVEAEINLDPKVKGQNQVFYYDIGHLPDFELQGIDKSHSLTKFVVSKGLDELAVQELDAIRFQKGKPAELTNEDVIQEMDLVTLQSVEVDEDNAPVEGGHSMELMVLVDKVNDEEFKKSLLQSKKDDILFFNARNVENYNDESRYRKYILKLEDDDDRTVGDMFRGEIVKVSRVTKSDIDSEFLTQNFGSDVESEEQALEMIKEELKNYVEKEAQGNMRREVRNHLLEMNNFSLPEAFLRRWLKSRKPNVSDEDLNPVIDAFFEDTRWTLIREKLGETIKPDVTEEEILREAANEIQSMLGGQNYPEYLVQMFVQQKMGDENERFRIKQFIETNKKLDAVIEQLSHVEKELSKEEFDQELRKTSESIREYNQRITQLNEVLS